MDTPILTIDEDVDVEERLTNNTVENILPARYLRKDGNGEVIESPAEMFERVAENVAGAEAEIDRPDWRERFETAMKELRFMPNSPTLMNAGTDMNQLSACFVVEPEDKMGEEDDSKFGEGIFPSATEAARIFQSGGGVGYPFHHLRPKGHHISSTGGEASGPVSFMEVFDTACNTVKQGGKRRGAQMGILRVDHPDVGRFITSKRKEGDLDNFNISVGVTDSFIEAVEEERSYTLSDPTTDYEEPYTVNEELADFYNYEYRNNPKSAFGEGDGKVVEENLWRDYPDAVNDTWAGLIDLEVGEDLQLPAGFIWEMMIDGAHRNGEPGIFYYDWTQEDHTFPESAEEYDIEATNPCAEQPLSEYEACNLGHINLSLMLDESAPTWDKFSEREYVPGEEFNKAVKNYVRKALDTEQFANTIETATRFLDNVVTQSDFPLDQIEQKVGDMRKIGVGVMGMAQMLYQMGVAYDSKLGRDISAEVLRIINRESAMNSAELAQERGPCAAYEDSKWADPQAYPEWFERHTGGLDAENWSDGFPVRNHNQTTIAPTGTTSMIGDTSGGCEPVYSVAYYKNVGGDIQGGDFLVEFDSYFLRTLEASGIDIDAVKAEAEEQMENDEWEGVSGLNAVPDEFGEVFVTTEQIDAEDHALMQRRLQEHVDSGISKTINLPSDATYDDVDSAYRLALSRDDAGKPAKGVTVYRDGSRDEQVKSTSADMSEAGENSVETDVDAVEMYQSGAVSDEDVQKLLKLSEAEEDESLCPECEEGILQMQESCSLCPECGFSPCS